MEQNDEIVLHEIERILQIWRKEARWLQIILSSLGLIGISGSLFISAFVGSDFVSSLQIRIIAFATTLCLTLIPTFNLRSKTLNYITAWRLLNKAIYSYKTGIIDMVTLLKSYEEGEKMLGSVEFQYTRSKIKSEMKD